MADRGDLSQASETPLRAYDIADAASKTGSPLVSNQVYRTLGCLIDQGHMQRIESVNGYLRRDAGADACLICEECHCVCLVKMPDLQIPMSKAAGSAGFVLERRVVEVHGHCPQCFKRRKASDSFPRTTQ